MTESIAAGETGGGVVMMRRTLLVLSLFVLAWPAAGNAEDDRPHALVDRFVRAWNAHDPKAMGDLFTEEADFVNADGQWSQGRPWIRAQLERFHTTTFKGTTLVETNTRVRMVRDNVAILHFQWELSGEVDAAGQRAPTRHGIMLIVAVQEVGGWRILSAQDTKAAPPV
jgi:uncharacterized protein (TIGR02246 family)